MITAQDIREKTFEKSKFGGYDMPEVDDFLEALADDVAAAQKENATLKSKMKVLVDKIEEYRSNEEALNLAIMSAQKLAVQIESDARARAAEMIAEADRQVKERLGSIDEQVEDYERRLVEAKASTRKYCDMVRAMCTTQINNIDAIADEVAPAVAAAAAPAEEAAVDSTITLFEDADTAADAESTQAFRL